MSKLDKACQRTTKKAKRRTCIDNRVCPECAGDLSVTVKSVCNTLFPGCSYYYQCEDCGYRCTRGDY